MVFDLTVHLSDLVLGGTFIVGGWKFAYTVRDELRAMRMTIYGCDEPPVDGLVSTVRQHSMFLADRGWDRRHVTRRETNHE